MSDKTRRINVVIGEDQYQALSERGLNISGLIRDLLGDYLAHNVVTVQVSEETRRIYDLLVSNTGATDREIETHLRAALAQVLEQRIDDFKELHQRLLKQSARAR